MKYGSYLTLQYVVPAVAYIFPFIITMIVSFIQLCLVKVDLDNEDEGKKTESYSVRYFKLHLKSARVLLGKAVCLRERDGAIVLHGFPFPGVAAVIYIFLSECLIAGTICTFTISSLIFHSTHSCRKHLDCFFPNTSSWDTEPIDCFQYPDDNSLICYEITINLGAAIGIAGGLLALSPKIFSLVTDVILTFALSETYLKVLLGVLQVTVYCLGIVFIVMLAVFKTDLIKSNIGLQLVVAILLCITLFCMPWCFLDREKERYYPGDDFLVQSGEGYDLVNSTERTPLNPKRDYRRNDRRNRRKN